MLFFYSMGFAAVLLTTTSRFSSSSAIVASAIDIRMESSSVGFSDFTGCSEPLDSCIADSTCAECIFSVSTSTATTTEHNECVEGYVEDYSMWTVCDWASASECCYLQSSESDCFANEAFSSYWECFVVESVGCSAEGPSCDGTSSVSANLRLRSRFGEFF